MSLISTAVGISYCSIPNVGLSCMSFLENTKATSTNITGKGRIKAMADFSVVVQHRIITNWGRS